MKLCLHSSYIVQNSFHFDEIFHIKTFDLLDVVVGQPSNVLKDSQIPVQGDLPKLPKETEVEIEPIEQAVIKPKQKSPNKKVDDVEDFVPEDQGIDNFLEIEDNIKAQCLKITQNVAFEFFNFAIFHQFLSY